MQNNPNNYNGYNGNEPDRNGRQSEYQPIFSENQQPGQMPLGYGNAQPYQQPAQPQYQNPGQSQPYYSPYQPDANSYGQEQSPYMGQQNPYFQGQSPYMGQQSPYAQGQYQDPGQYQGQGQYQQPGYGYQQPQYQAGAGQPYGGYVDPNYSAGYSQNPYAQNFPPQQQNIPQNSEEPEKPDRHLSLPISENMIILIVGLLVLPLLFVLGVVLPVGKVFQWIYIIAALVSLVLMWLRRSNNPNQRLTLTVVHAVMCIITLVSLLTPAPADTKTTNQPASNQSLAANAGLDSTGAISSDSMSFVPEEPVPAPTEEPAQSSAALDSLNSFLYLWTTNNQTGMLNYCSPNWVKSQERPEVSLFSIIANRLPTSYTIEKMSGTDSDISRTATVTATIIRQSSTASEEKYRYQIIMTQENGNWYVDPSSLKSNEKAETPSPVSEATAAPSSQATADPNLILYYNTDGGKLYHIDPYCSSVDKKYQPLTGTFRYSEIYDSQYSKLTKCAKCGAPKRQPKSE